MSELLNWADKQMLDLILAEADLEWSIAKQKEHSFILAMRHRDVEVEKCRLKSSIDWAQAGDPTCLRSLYVEYRSRSSSC